MYDSAEESKENGSTVAQMKLPTVMMMMMITGVLMSLFS